MMLSLVIILLDQYTKILATESLILYQPKTVTDFFNLTLMHNPGAAFSFLGDAGGWQRWLFIGLAVAVSIWIVIWISFTKQTRWVTVALACILGGAIGNLIDRIYLGYVVDFLDFYVGNWSWPTFNIADTAITIGAIMIVLDLFRGTPNKN